MISIRKRIVAASSRMIAPVVALLFSSTLAFAAETAVYEVPPELWDRPRSGRAVLAVPAVQRVLGDLASAPAALLTIRHAPGVEATGQAEELRAWLVSHALDAERIVLRPDLAARQSIQLDVDAPQAR